ncbi:1,5-anhydro-D-fructose reductase [Rosistilla oblonga]|uniref:1,5-anhydro-D-fructose reductase n=1 Tax=Rosistilla oblonga TaxID=2527990 RepID=A0A518IQG5_9BACT|nr:1,5-anhydro-D-fructose reductase [Rosistilla oblonga]
MPRRDRVSPFLFVALFAQTAWFADRIFRLNALRFGVLGTARIARRIVADMQSVDAIQVVGIASRDPARARWYADQYGIAQAFDSYDAMLASDSIDAIYIPLPPSLHHDWALAAADAGKHLIVEKPVAMTLAEAQAIDQRCRDRGRQWLDATAWLHHLRTDRIRQSIDAGELGRVQHISVACSFFEPFQSDDHRLKPDLGGGCLLDLGWYAYGMARWAAGRLPVAVQSIGRQDRGIWFRSSSLLDFGDDLTATVNCAYDTATRKWFEIAGDQASIVCDDFTRPWPSKPARFWIHDRAGSAKSETFDGNQEARMLATFADLVSNATAAAAMNQQALDTQQILQTVADGIAS